MRQFLAARLPDAVNLEVAALQARIKGSLGGWRWLRPEGIHLTLRFLGEVAPDLDGPARTQWRNAVVSCSPFGVRLAALGRFPPRGRARVLWVGLEETQPGERLAALAARLESAARELGFEAENRGFRPHLTLARRSRTGSPDDPGQVDDRAAGEGWVREVVLYRSHLESTGARYTALESYPLEGGVSR